MLVVSVILDDTELGSMLCFISSPCLCYSVHSFAPSLLFKDEVISLVFGVF